MFQLLSVVANRNQPKKKKENNHNPKCLVGAWNLLNLFVVFINSFALRNIYFPGFKVKISLERSRFKGKEYSGCWGIFALQFTLFLCLLGCKYRKLFCFLMGWRVQGMCSLPTDIRDHIYRSTYTLFNSDGHTLFSKYREYCRMAMKEYNESRDWCAPSLVLHLIKAKSTYTHYPGIALSLDDETSLNNSLSL